MGDRKNIAFGGVFCAVSLVILYLACILPTIKIALCAVAGSILFIPIVSKGVSLAIKTYVATSILALVILPSKSIAIAYLLFLGNYAMVKLYIEKMDSVFKEWAFKLIYLNVVLLVLYFIASEFFSLFLLGHILFKLIFLIAGNIAFILYDFAFSQFINFFVERFKKK